ncbi:MAG TPA: FtsL-like putative cell division protein [Bacteroidales bacterium]|nr:FtsL-like putative cell division protein [Bacteroidales bacterium]
MEEAKDIKEVQDNREPRDEVKKVTIGTLMRDLMSGTIVTDKLILKNIWFLFLLTFLGALYIANRFHAERITRETSRLQKEVRDLRSESLSTSARLMHESNQSQVYKLVKDHELGLEELREPPYKLVVRGGW